MIYVTKAGEEEDWYLKKKTRDRVGWKILSNEAAKSCWQHLSPDKGKQEEGRDIGRSSCWFCGSDNQKVVVCVTCLLRLPRQLQLDGKGFQFHTSRRQAFLRRQLMQYECSCTNVHNMVNM